MPITPLSLEQSKKKEKEEEVGFFESALAGVVTGLWNIPKGFVSLGAEIFDLVGDTNTAKVALRFIKINDVLIFLI